MTICNLYHLRFKDMHLILKILSPPQKKEKHLKKQLSFRNNRKKPTQESIIILFCRRIPQLKTV